MSIVYNRTTRRQFLVGTGNTLMALPLLPSLLPATAYAQSTEAPRRMMLFWFDHNNLSTLWPNRSVATTAVGSNGAREILLRNIGSTAMISPVFSNSRWESWKNSDQITMLRGFDTAQAYGPAHGNYTLASGAGRNSEGNHPTMDTVIEASRTVYPATTPIHVRRALRVSVMGGSLFYQKVGSTVQQVPNYDSELIRFYNDVFSSLSNGTSAPADNTNQLKSNILNRVFGSFTSFKNNRRISADDRARLDQHMSMISDLQRSFASAQQPAPPSCTRPSAPQSGLLDMPTTHRLYFDLLAIAMRCNLTQFGVMAMDAHDPTWIPGLNFGSEGGVHNAMHGSQGSTAQERGVNQQNAYQIWWTYYANQIAERFLAPLDVQEGNTGRTYLQNMLTGMLCVGGIHGIGGDGGHSGLDSQQILIGSMGGRLRSGRYYSMPGNNSTGNMAYNTFLITLMHLMGMPASEYAPTTPNNMGFGFYGDFSANHPLRSRFYGPITEILT